MADHAQAQSRFLTANGLRHHLLEWEGDGRTVLMLHGFLDLAWGLSAVAERLAARGFHVVAPDLRGHGDTDRVGAGGWYHFLDYVADVDDLARQVARERLYVVGHSMGGGVASYWAGAFPGRARRMVLAEGTHVPELPWSEMPARVAEWTDGMRRLRDKAPRVHASRDAAAARIRDEDPRCPPDFAALLAEKGTRPVDGGVVFKHDPLHRVRGPMPFQLDLGRAFWQRIACPVLFVEGADSPFRHLPDREARYAVFPDSRKLVVEGAGHMMFRHAPAAVASAIGDFLDADG